MFHIEITDEYGDVTNDLEYDDLAKALKAIESEVFGGRSVDCITLRQEIEFKVEISAYIV